jgi:2-amino-4-hydroxy-6-hydroxymethyldihydropteridine diphosphokinase
VRWSARALDLDLLLFGDEVIRTPRLVVPHPALVARRFVLAPLAELCPGRVVPGTGRTVAQLLALVPPEDVVPAGLYPM